MSDFRFTPALLVEVREQVRLRRSRVEISRQVGCTIKTLERICAHHGIDLATPADHCVAVQASVFSRSRYAIEQEAARRGASIEEIAGRCLDLIAADNLFAALLDR